MTVVEDGPRCGWWERVGRSPARRAHRLDAEGVALCGAVPASAQWAPAHDLLECRTCVEHGRAGIGALVEAGLLTWRQADYWTRRGWLRPAVVSPGTGCARTWSVEELAVAGVMAGLVGLGFPPDLAHRVARFGGRVAPGVIVFVDPDALRHGEVVPR